MNQFQIIKRDKTWQDEKKMENKQADEEEENASLALLPGCYI